MNRKKFTRFLQQAAEEKSNVTKEQESLCRKKELSI